MHFQILGRRYSFNTNNPLQAERLREVFGPFLSPLPDTVDCSVSVTQLDGRLHRVVVDGRSDIMRLGMEWPTAVNLLKLAVVRDHPSLVFVHASAVFRGDGAIVLIGSSRTGKSTLSRALTGKGFNRLADDMLPIDLVTGSAYPFVTSAKVRPGGPVLPAPPWDGESAAVPEVLPVKHLVFLSAPADGADLRCRHLTAELAVWRRMMDLCCGRQLPDAPQPSVLTWRPPESYNVAPALAACSKAEALRSLLPLLHPPVLPLRELLPAACRFLRNTQTWNFQSGWLEETTALLTAVLE